MKADMILKKKEDAVSPVIGVMLMLVVTIVIAAVVAAFASGMGGDVEAAPAAVLDIDVYSDGDVKITHLSGESLVTKDVTVKLLNVENGEKLAEKNLPTSVGSYFTPGSTATIEKTATGLTANTFVTVNVLYDGKHVIVNKDVMVKA